ncbi:MAG: BamA/TamA family outer membrane protein [Bacteroidetes bacterium]|nr:BamA/TamA family outer membrane protein [Bacteroidota bacterium]
MNFSIHKIIFLILTLLFLISCNTVKYLEGDQTYLTKNSIKFPKGKKIKNKSSLEYELATLYKQVPNQKFFWASRRYFYFSQFDTLGRNKIGKGWKRFEGQRLAEAPVYFDEETAKKTAESMKYFLQHKGYFWAETDYFFEHNKKRQKTEVTYKVSPKRQYKIDTIAFISKDKRVEKILNEISGETFLKKDKPVDVNLYNQEVTRITKHLRNSGYAYFQPQFVSGLESLDSTNFRVDLELEVYPPKGKEEHQVYHIGEITLFPRYGENFNVNQLPDTTIQCIHFVTNGIPFRVKPKTLLNSIALKKGDLYQRENENDTNVQLSSLGVFNFVTIRSEEDSLQQGVLNFKVYLTQNKKWEFGTDFDINQTERLGEVVNRNLIGLSLSPSLKSRNLFKGAELLISSVDFGIELAPFQDTVLNTLDFKIQGDLYLPRFTDYFKFWKGLREIGILKKSYYDKLVARANNKFSMGYNYYTLLDYYTFNLFNFSYGYNVQTSQKSQFIVNNLGVDFLLPTPTPSFDTILMQNPFLQNSFSNQLLTGFILRDFTYIYSPQLSRTGGTWYFQGTAEMSGVEVLALNKLFNGVSGNSSVWKVSDVDFSQYFRLELDLRRYWQRRANQTIITRVSSGVVIPFGNSSEAPYVKQFFVGGPQSVRGWYARGIGPGSYFDDTTTDINLRNSFYQTGDLKLEWNVEYRFHMFRPLNLFDFNGAFFIDGGNVWTIDADENGERLGSKFQIENTFKEMAVSVGTGFRFDFTYFIFRVDFGKLIKNNYPDPLRNNSYWVDDLRLWKGAAWHLGLGYPF